MKYLRLFAYTLTRKYLHVQRRLILASLFSLLGLGLWFTYALSSTSTPQACDALFQIDPSHSTNETIRVGISDDAMTSYQHRKLIFAPHSAEETLTITDGTSGKHSTTTTPPTLWQATNIHQLTLEPSAQGIEATVLLQGGSGSKQGERYHWPKDITLTTSGTSIRVLNLTRKKTIPSYRNELHIRRRDAQALQLINQLPMETYLQAVVPNELPIRFGIEAVRAQAVAARTYAIRPRDSVWNEFDICDSQYCQAYYGQQTETPETTALLKATQGLVLLHGSKPILALYSSSTGGVSGNYHQAFSDPTTQAFPSTPLPYLGVVADFPETLQPFLPLSDEGNLYAYLSHTSLPAFDAAAPHYRWQRSFSRSELEANLPLALQKLSTDTLTQRWIHPHYKPNHPFGKLTQLTVSERAANGQAMELHIRSTTGQWTVRKEFCIRKVFLSEGKALPSALMVLKPNNPEPNNPALWQSLTVLGAGFGHGVGMSQYGASGMHHLGYPFHAILNHYYPHTSLGSIPLKLHPLSAQQQRVFGISGNTPKLHLHFNESLGGTTLLPKLTSPVWVKINDTVVKLAPFRGKGRIYPIDAFWKPNELNTIVWQGKHPQASKLTVWVTLEPQQTTPTKATVLSAPSEGKG
jgi:SpoIID/LytB domain protein